MRSVRSDRSRERGEGGQCDPAGVAVKAPRIGAVDSALETALALRSIAPERRALRSDILRFLDGASRTKGAHTHT
jgi:hypothetical protein